MINKALSYDDVLLVPHKSTVLPGQVDTSTRLSKNIKLSIPIVSSAMDTVTESNLAIAVAKAGGIGIIHKNMSVERQTSEVRKVKKVQKPLKRVLNLLVGAAISVGDEQFNRAVELAKAGVDILVIDTAHGHSAGVINQLIKIKKDKRFKKVDIIVGNIATSQAAYDLAMSGADAVKVGVGPGAICTTRVVTGVGVPQLTAVMEAVRGVRRTKKNIPVIADGGIKYSGDIAKAIAAGAEAVMLGSLLAGTKESPGKIIKVNNKQYKSYRGMGSLAAMQKGSKDRYAQSRVQNKKLVPEGISGFVPYSGTVEENLYQLVGGLRSSMGYLGSKDIKTFQKNAEFVKITSAGRSESHPHSMSKIDSTANYKVY